MKIELYLKDINQDMIKRPEKLGKARVNPDNFQWTKDICCILDCCVFKSNHYSPDVCDPFRGMVLRQESFGGLLWDSTNGHVFKVDREAYELFNDLSKAKTIQPVLEKYKISEDDLRKMLIKVGRATEKC